MKKRLSLLLAFLLVIGLIAVNVIAEGTDYASNVEGTAVFNPALNSVDADGVTTYGVAYITDDPSAGLKYDMDYTISLEGLMGQTFLIDDVYVGEDGYWYQLAPLEGETLPGNLATKSWVYQNDISAGGYVDTLLVTPPAPKPTDPTDPSDPSESCGCCDNCTNAAGCQCGCEECDFCENETPTEPEEYPNLEDSETGVKVTLESLPQGVSLEVNERDSSAAMNAFRIPESRQVFALDISLRNADSTDYQPGAALVKVPVSAAPGTKLGIVHKHGDEDAVFMGVTEVLSDGTVEFFTDSFSEFAGFTVDFHYNGVDFSIDGKTSIKLSELFAVMNIPEDAYAAESVVFSNDSLVTTERLVDGDWLLTSLEAFDTNETLVITFTGGRTIVIDVTDEKQVDDYWEGLEHHKTFQIFDGVNFDLRLIYNIFGDIAANYHLQYKLVNMSQNGTKGSEIASDKATHEHNLANIVGHSFASSTYWFYVGDQWAKGSWILGGPPEIYIDNHSTDTTLTIGCSWLGLSGREAGVHVYAIPLTIPLETAADNVCDISQRSQVSENRETRTVNIYVDGTYVGKQSGNVYFPSGDYRGIESGNGTSTGDLRVTPASGYYRRGDVGGATTVEASGTTYKVYLVTRGTIAYDPNGGTGAPASQYKYHGVNLTLQSGTPTKAYSNFKGWATSKARADAGTVDYPAGGTYTGNLTPNSTTTLYAVWEYANANYTVKHYKQNLAGTGYDEVTADRQTITAKAYDKVTPSVKSYEGFTAPATQTVTVSGDGTTVVEYKYSRNSYNVTVNANTTNNGIGSVTGGGSYKYGASVTINATVNNEYEWVNWTGTTTAASQSYTFTMPASNVTYTANAKPITYTISYTLNGGTNHPDNPSSYNIESAAITLKDPTKNGFAFDGWTGSNGTTAQTSVTIPTGSTGNKSYTAKWTPNEYTYNIVYVSSTGKALGTNTVTYQYGTTNEIVAPAKAGYNTPSSQSVKWDSTTAKTITFTYTPITYTISYDLKGGTNHEDNPASYNIESAAITLKDPTKNGFTFAGWTGSNGTTAQTSVTIPTGSTGDRSYTATWSKNSYKVTYVYEGQAPDNAPELPAEANVKFADAVTVADAPTLDGYTFSGWTADGITITDGAFTMPADDVTLTGKWTPIDYTITYKFEDGVTADKIVHYDIEDDLTVEAEPKREGFEFTGWMLETVTGTNWIADTYDAGQKIGTGKYGSITLVAQWEGMYSYELSFDANGGQGAPDTMTADWNEHEEFTFRWTQVPTRDGYNFMGWAKSADSTQNVAGEGMNTYTMTGEKNTVVKETLYAIWERQTGNLALDYTGTKPAIVTVEGEGLNITLVLSSDMTITDLPTGTYKVTAKGAAATTTVSVSDGNPAVTYQETTTVTVTVTEVATNWFTGFCQAINIFKKEGEG